MTKSQAEPITGVKSINRVYDAVRELRAQGQTATRETVAELTSLKLTIVDDRLSVLVDDGKLKRVLRGVYELVEVYPPPRAISKTVTSDGWVIYEVGDEVFKLSPSEDRVLAMLTAGAATQVAAIEAGRQVVTMTTEMQGRIAKLQREVSVTTGMQAKITRLRRELLAVREMQDSKQQRLLLDGAALKEQPE